MSTIKTGEPDEISVTDLIARFNTTAGYVKKQWILILIISILGGITGLLYSSTRKTIYTATSTFVLDDGNKSNNLSRYEGLASMAGIDIGGSPGNSIFQGDNILELYKSRIMIEKTLLSASIFQGKSQLLINRFLEFNKIEDNRTREENLLIEDFSGSPSNFSRTQDSIISEIVILFNKKILTVSKPDKKISIIRVDISNKDELFARDFNTRLVETVNNFYTQTKTKKSINNIKILNHLLDSIKIVLNNSMMGVASAIDASPNASPFVQRLKVTSQRKQIDVQASTAIYSELVKNLEISKMSLLQETPLIQLIDTPVLPLTESKSNRYVGFLTGFVLSSIAIIIVIMIQAFYRKSE